MAADEIQQQPEKLDASSTTSNTTLNTLDIVGKVTAAAGAVETVVGGAVGYMAGAVGETINPVNLFMSLSPYTADVNAANAAIASGAVEGAAVAAAPGALGVVGGAAILSLKEQLKFDQQHPDIALDVIKGTAGGPGL